MRHSLKGEDGRLTEEGRELAKKIGRELGQNYSFGWAISSPEERAYETARLISGKSCPVQKALEVGIPREEMAIILRLFAKLGNAPLAKYFAEGPEIEQKLLDYGQTGWNMLVDVAQVDHVLVVGHEVLAPAICAVATKKNHIIMNSSFQECEGATLTLNEKNEVVHIGLF